MRIHPCDAENTSLVATYNIVVELLYRIHVLQMFVLLLQGGDALNKYEITAFSERKLVHILDTCSDVCSLI